MYAGCKFLISGDAPKKSVLAGFPTQTHLKAGGAMLRLRIIERMIADVVEATCRIRGFTDHTFGIDMHEGGA